MMALTQAVPTRGALTAPDAASTTTEDRVGRREDEHLGPELLPNHGEQRLDQPWTRGARPWGGLAGYSRTTVSVNQPAFSSTLRASSTPRCP